MALATIAAAATLNSYRINERNTTAVGGVKTVRYHQYTPAVMSSGGSATTNAGDVQYISTKFKDDNLKGFGIVKLNKLTGEVEDRILIGDRDPVYAVNENKKLMFYKSAKTDVSIQSLK